MKTKFLYLAALALVVSFTACENNTPFDTQTENDDPIILKPYNESGTGSFTYDLATPDTPLYDSVTVTPSRYTTVNWYLDGVMVFTGVKIDMTFPVGKYDLIIEAVTTVGKRTERYGSVTVHPYASDPYVATPAGGFHLVPGIEMSLEGANMDKVATIELTKDIYAKEVVSKVAPSSATASQIKFTLPATADGTYYFRLVDKEGKVYGLDKAAIHNGAVILDGYQEFVPGDKWVLTGVSLDKAASVTVDETVIKELEVTSTSITLTAPEAEPGEHKLSVANQDGSAVLFVTSAGTVSEVTTIVPSETTIWSSPQYLQWDAERVKVVKDIMANVPVESTIFIYYEKLPENHEGYYDGGEYKQYYALRITTPWWGDNPDVDDIVPQMDMGSATSPYSFMYDARRKALVDERGAMSLVGWGLNITKITFK